jgi:hypothetical protein
MVVVILKTLGLSDDVLVVDSGGRSASLTRSIITLRRTPNRAAVNTTAEQGQTT